MRNVQIRSVSKKEKRIIKGEETSEIYWNISLSSALESRYRYKGPQFSVKKKKINEKKIMLDLHLSVFTIITKLRKISN